MKKILVYDTETGGLDPATCGLTQVCAGVCEFSDDWSSFEIAETFDTVIKECPGLVYSDEAMAIQKRTKEDLKNGMSIGYAIRGVEDLSVKHFGKVKAATPYGVNVKFDIDFTDANCKRYKLGMPFNFVYRDICQWFRLLQDMGAHDRFKANLDTIAFHYGIELNRSEKHDAVDDVRATANAIRYMMYDFRAVRS